MMAHSLPFAKAKTITMNIFRIENLNVEGTVVQRLKCFHNIWYIFVHLWHMINKISNIN